VSDHDSECVGRQPCPAWCTRTTCGVSNPGVVVWHTGAGLVWSSAHVSFDVGLLRRDRAGWSGLADTEIRVVLTTPDTGNGASMELSPAEARTIAGRLVALADLADATALSGEQRW
jgi:hypothetical protein